MSQLIEWLSRLFSSWKFWVVVPPWEIGVRVRLGKMAAALQPGIHFRIPALDDIVMVNTRLRIEATPTVTIKGSRENKARIITAQVGYAIKDPVAALLKYTFPGPAIQGVAQSRIAAGEGPEAVLEALRREVGPYGIEVAFVYFAENVEVRTYRLLSGGGSVYSGTTGVGEPTARGMTHY